MARGEPLVEVVKSNTARRVWRCRGSSPSACSPRRAGSAASRARSLLPGRTPAGGSARGRRTGAARGPPAEHRAGEITRTFLPVFSSPATSSSRLAPRRVRTRRGFGGHGAGDRHHALGPRAAGGEEFADRDRVLVVERPHRLSACTDRGNGCVPASRPDAARRRSGAHWPARPGIWRSSAWQRRPARCASTRRRRAKSSVFGEHRSDRRPADGRRSR